MIHSAIKKTLSSRNGGNFSLQTGLLCVGYFRLVICAFTVMIQAAYLIMVRYMNMWKSVRNSEAFTEVLFSLIPSLTDLVLTVIFITATHKKHIKLFEMYCYYCVTMVLSYLLVVVLVSYDMEEYSYVFELMFPYSNIMETNRYNYIGFGVLIILLQSYLTIMAMTHFHYLKENKKSEQAALINPDHTMMNTTPDYKSELVVKI